MYFETAKIKIYNEIHVITVEQVETIVTAAMRQGHDIPFSCQIGACGTCRASLISGTVEMDENDALTAKEIDRGYILACQAHPTSENVFIDFD